MRAGVSLRLVDCLAETFEPLVIEHATKADRAVTRERSDLLVLDAIGQVSVQRG